MVLFGGSKKKNILFEINFIAGIDIEAEVLPGSSIFLLPHINIK